MAAKEKAVRSRLIGLGALRLSVQTTASDLLAAIVVLAILPGLVVCAALAQLPSPVFWTFYSASILLLPIVWMRTVRRPAVAVSALLIWFATHKLLIAILVPDTAPAMSAWLQNYKEWMYLALLVTLFSWRFSPFGHELWTHFAKAANRARPPDFLAAGLVALVSIYFLIGLLLGAASLAQELTYARRFASLPIIYLSGRMLLSTARGHTSALRIFVGLGVVVAFFGLAERLLLGQAFWTDVVHIDALRTALVTEGFGSGRSRLVDGVPANWMAYLGDERVRRLVATFLEPTTLAIFFALVLCLAVFAFPKWRARSRTTWILSTLAIASALLLTIGKAGFLIAAIIAVVVASRATRRSGVRLLIFVSLMAGVGMLIGQYLPFADNLARHARGLLSGFSHMLEAPLGTGLGTTGFWGDLVGVGSDSTVGVIASQIGALGAVLWIAWLACLGYQLLPVESSLDAISVRQRIFAGGILGLMVTSLVSNSTSGLLGATPYLLLGGWLVSVVEANDGHARSGSLRNKSA